MNRRQAAPRTTISTSQQQQQSNTSPRWITVKNSRPGGMAIKYRFIGSMLTLSQCNEQGAMIHPGGVPATLALTLAQARQIAAAVKKYDDERTTAQVYKMEGEGFARRQAERETKAKK